MPSVWRRGPFTSVQVNIDDFGRNIPGDAGNEPSIAIDPTNPCRMVIGWRQFDSVESDFRQAGVAYSGDAGEHWVFRGPLTPGIFASDPVLSANAEGVIYYLSPRHIPGSEPGPQLFRSFDAGATWEPLAQIAPGLLDKPWMAIDTTGGVGNGHIYLMATGFLTIARSTDGGHTFTDSLVAFPPSIGTLAVAPTGDLFAVSFGGVYTYTGAQNATENIEVESLIALPTDVCAQQVNSQVLQTRGTFPPNPGGLIGQDWIGIDHSGGPTHGNIYVTTRGACGSTLIGLLFFRSTDGAVTFDDPVRINDDPLDSGSISWFPTMTVAPNGRIDVTWNDTRRYAVGNLSELYYAYSTDAGETWSKNIPVSRVFDSHVGWPRQDKLGDYYDMISDDAAANVAYAATFNGEQDVYFLRIGDCNGNGTHDSADIADGTSSDLNANTVPDECELGDFTGDIAVDLVDMLVFTVCQTKPCPDDSCDPALYPAPVCALGDFDADGDLDLRDFAALQSTFDLAAARPSW